MCGIVAYFGGAGNNLTRVLTAMSAMIYRAPDSTGVGFFGDDREPIRARKSIGSVTQLTEVLLRDVAYPNPSEELISLWALESDDIPPHEYQRRLLDFEGLSLEVYESLLRGNLGYPSFDELVDLHAEKPKRLSPGWPGRPGPLPLFFVRSEKELQELIQDLITRYDLSSVVIQSIIRKALSETLFKRQEEESLEIDPLTILTLFDQLFENAFLEEKIQAPVQLDYSLSQRTPYAQEMLWNFLAETPIKISSDFDRDGVRCLFRLLDAALLCHLSFRPEIHDVLQEILETTWHQAQKSFSIDWRTLYAIEKGCNVYGLAAASALSYLQKEEFFPDLFKNLSDKQPKDNSIDIGQTDAVCLRYFSLPILSHGRWANQAPVTIKNAHPFFDETKQRAIIINGQFDGKVEAELHEFLEQVGGFSFRSENSAEYFPLLWGYYFELLHSEKKRYNAISNQVEAHLEEYGIGSQAIDYYVYHQVKEKSPAELDELAFLKAAQRIIAAGGQLAVAGVSLQSPRSLYVASHNRPVFVVRRIENDDFMVVSDINAAMGLFPQAMIHEKTLELQNLRRRQGQAVDKLRKNGALKEEINACKKHYQEEEDMLLKVFEVKVFPLDGEEIFARIGTRFEDGTLHREVAITDFDGNSLPDVEPFTTVLSPPQIQKDFYGSFYETHLHEIPERLTEILRFYVPEEDTFPQFDIRERFMRRRFGQGFSDLKRLVLVGAGSSYNMGIIGKNFIQTLILEMDVLVLSPAEVDNIRRIIVPDEDLVILLSWSSTTADMIQFAKELSAYNVVMIAITEKIFADMALIATKSGGVITTLSGEEVTISGIKSTMCMLFCLKLFFIWLASQLGHEKNALMFLKRLYELPNIISDVLNDENILAFCKSLASKSSHSYASMIFDATLSTGTGREVGLKLEENTWTAISKSLDYRDLSLYPLKKDLNEILTIVNATSKARLKESLGIMKRLYRAGIPFAVVSYVTREQSEIERYSQGQFLCLPKIEDTLQPLIDLVFYYLFAFHYGMAHGRAIGEFPRNRVKSVTLGRSRPKKMLTPAGELHLLEENNNLLIKRESKGTRIAKQNAWERKASLRWEKKYYREMHQLAGIFHEDNPLQSMLKIGPKNLKGLTRAIFEDIAEEGEIIFAPLDRGADTAARNVVSQWGKVLGCSMRVAAPREPLSHFQDDALFILVASKTLKGRLLTKLMQNMPSQCLWFGPQIPEKAAQIFNDRSLGYFALHDTLASCKSQVLYAALSYLFINAWKEKAPAKAEIVEKHFRMGTDIIQLILDDLTLKKTIMEVMNENSTYKTAFFIGPYIGTGLGWVDRFNQAGHCAMEWHTFGESVHGPLVTVDPRVDNKFVRLRSNDQMISLYGEEQVLQWSNQYLGGKNIDTFLDQPPRDLSFRAETPFFAEGHWYFPELQTGYDTAQDNLIIVDATSERYFSQALDELANYGCRYARIIVISQEPFRNDPKKRALYKYPISHLLFLPSLEGQGEKIPISEFHLPFAINLMGVAMAAATGTTVKNSHKTRKGEQ
jgi:glucosamine 6-phosphate synthetase-like amidotransferase/phosphosugar isomerase protein